MIQLILSLDYEIFGNGAGDVMRDVIRPTERLLDICDRHGAKMTIMFEVGAYWAFEHYDDRLQPALGYSPCQVMKAQMVKAIERGHDVQLHLHPQWIGAEHDHGAWRLRNACWRLADLPDGLGDEEHIASIAGALARGKQTLEDMLRPIKPDYECACFRAGGFYAQPSRDIIRAMRDVGLRADSSVVKGFRRTAPYAVDYSRVRIGGAAWWTTDTELTEEGTPGENVIELSVSARMEPYWRSFKPAKLQAARRRRQLERASRNGHGNGHSLSSVPSCRTVLKQLLTKRASTFDFCKLSSRDMLKRLRELGDVRQQPVVMIGHTKDFVNDRHFEAFLAALACRANVRFTTISQCVQALLSAAKASGSREAVDAGLARWETQ